MIKSLSSSIKKMVTITLIAVLAFSWTATSVQAGEFVAASIDSPIILTSEDMQISVDGYIQPRGVKVLVIGFAVLAVTGVSGNIWVHMGETGIATVMTNLTGHSNLIDAAIAFTRERLADGWRGQRSVTMDANGNFEYWNR